MIQRFHLFIFSLLLVSFTHLHTEEVHSSFKRNAPLWVDRQSRIPSQGHRGPQVYSLESVPAHPLIEQYIDRYTQEDWLNWLLKVDERAEPYRDFIAAKILELEVPQELIYLPLVESAFRIDAVSRSGAVGLWQFMLNSIGPYDMNVNEWMDERRDFWKSTEGALRKLKYNYSKLGDWLLALAAYNCGLGRVTRAVHNSGYTDFWSLAEHGWLPSETVHYIPRFIALVQINTYRSRYNLPISWDSPRQWVRIPLDQAVDLRKLAAETNIPLQTLKTGNAELHFDVTPPSSSGYHLKIPAESADIVTNVLQENRDKLMQFYIYHIRSGDTLYALARHYGLNVDFLIRYNPSLRPERLQVGDRVIIPALREIAPYRGSLQNGVAQNRDFTDVYTIRHGDTLWGIASRFNCTADELAASNNLNINGVIHPGKTLLVPREN